MGDAHFVRRENVATQSDDRPACFCYDTERYAGMSETVLPQLVAEIAEADVDFIVQLGDFEQGHRDPELAKGDFTAGLRLFESAAPTHVARGGHDYPDTAFESIIVPHNAERVGQALQTPYYSFEHGNSLFVVLDLVPRASEEQWPWLERELARGEGFEHVFVLGHEPAFSVGRPFFTSLHKAARMSRLFAQYQIDCYLCGHTHNQSIVARRVGKRLLLQAMSCAVGDAQRDPIPLDEVRTWLVPRGEAAYCWPGYVENSAPGWVLIEVDGGAASMEWRRVGDGPHVRLNWRRGQTPTETFRRPFPPRRRLSVAELGRISRAWLCLCVDRSDDRPKTVTLNRAPIAEFPSMVQHYHHRTEIPADAVRLLALSNELRIVADADDRFCVSSVQLSAQLDSGETVRSSLAPYMYATTDEFNAWQQPLLCRAPTAAELPPITVSF